MWSHCATLQWRHKEHHGVWNHRRLVCLFSRLYKLTSKHQSPRYKFVLCSKDYISRLNSTSVTEQYINIWLITWDWKGDPFGYNSRYGIRHDGDLSCTWWRHQLETVSALLAIYAGNSQVTCEFPTQRPVTRSFDVFFDLHLNKRFSKQWWGWWFETPSCSLWRHCNAGL